MNVPLMKFLSHYELLKINFGCSCKPYHDIKTFEEWNASGYAIRKGAKANKVFISITYKKIDEQGERDYTKENFVYLFCRCQAVKKKK